MDLGARQVRGSNQSSTVLFSSPDGIYTWNAWTQARTHVEIPGGRDTLPMRINEAGQVVGMYLGPSDYVGLVWPLE